MALAYDWRVWKIESPCRRELRGPWSPTKCWFFHRTLIMVHIVSVAHAVTVLMKECVRVPSEKLFKMGKLRTKPKETGPSQQNKGRKRGRAVSQSYLNHAHLKHTCWMCTHRASPGSPTVRATESRGWPLFRVWLLQPHSGCYNPLTSLTHLTAWSLPICLLLVVYWTTKSLLSLR